MGRPMNVGRPQGYINAGAPPPPLPLPPEWRPAGPTLGTLDPASAAAAALTAASSFAGNPYAPASAANVAPPSLSGLHSLYTLPGMPAAAPPVGRKQRELYVGNLPVGAVTAADLRELFSAPLRTMAGFDESIGPPVLNVDVASEVRVYVKPAGLAAPVVQRHEKGKDGASAGFLTAPVDFWEGGKQRAAKARRFCGGKTRFVFTTFLEQPTPRRFCARPSLSALRATSVLPLSLFLTLPFCIINASPPSWTSEGRFAPPHPYSHPPSCILRASSPS